MDNYSTLFYREGGGILPAMLMPANGSGWIKESTSLLGMQANHPIFQFLRGRFELPAATITRYFPRHSRAESTLSCAPVT